MLQRVAGMAFNFSAVQFDRSCEQSAESSDPESPLTPPNYGHNLSALFPSQKLQEVKL
jgi:hypothetical protein